MHQQQQPVPMASSCDQISPSSSVSTLTNMSSNVSTATTEETVVASEEEIYGLVTPTAADSNMVTGSTTSLATSVSVSTTATLTAPPPSGNSNSSSSSQLSMPDDVIKCGHMRKLKNNHRKFFVLRRNHIFDKGHITLSYYDSEKKFRANPESSSQLPRRTTLLKHCWNVHRKFDKNGRPVMAIYTREDMLATICEDDNSLTEWVNAIGNELSQMGMFFTRPFRVFDHIWQVSINRQGLGMTRNITGLHRVALASTILYIFRVDPTAENSDVYEFPLSSIRKCGHNSSTFFLELGRSSLIGAGSLWLQTEDQAMAAHMHEVVLATMTSGRSKRSQHDESAAAPALPRSNSTSSHRPRSSSTSTEAGKSVTSSIVPQNGSTTSVSTVGRSNSHSRRGSKQLQSPPQLPSTSSTPIPGQSQPGQTQSGNEALHGHGMHHASNIPHHYHHGAGHNHHHMYQYGHNRNGMPAQSPAASRERLHSGSWSRTTSECSNEDGSSGASSNAATTPVGAANMNIFCDSCLNNMSASNMHIWSSSSSSCPCSGGVQHSNLSLDYHSSMNGNNSSAHSSMDCIDSMFVPDHECYQHNAGGVLTLEPPISEEADGSEENQMMAPDSNENSKSNSNQSISSMTSSKSATGGCLHGHGHHSNQLYCVHMTHLQPIRSNSLSASDRRHASPLTSPKCSCSGCQQHYNNGGLFTLPTVPAGTDADYVPMTPLSQQGSSENATAEATSSQKSDATANRPKQAEEEEDSYLNMAPMSPEAKTSSSSMSSATGNTSGEFHLEKVRSYYGDQGYIGGPPVAHHPPANQMVSTCGQPASMDDSIFNGLTRAYSTGSRPQPLAPSIAAQCTVAPKAPPPPPTSQDSRTRAFSTGSHGLSMKAFRLKSRRQNKHQQPQQQPQQQLASTSFEGETIVSSSSSSLAEMEADNVAGCVGSANNKASSAPILSPLIHQRTRSATLGARPVATTANQQMMHQPGCTLNEVESDMMEIDYSRKRGSSRSNVVTSSFEEELREARKASRSRQSSTSGPSGSEAVFQALKSGASTSLDGSTAVQPGQSNHGRKRSDSTSAISNFFGPARPHGHGHHVTFRTGGNTFDHLVASFRQSLNIQPTSVVPDVKKAANSTSTEADDEACYMLTSPTNSKTKSQEQMPPSSTTVTSPPAKSESKGITASLTSIWKNTKMGSTEKLRPSQQPPQSQPAASDVVSPSPDQPQGYTVMSPLSSTGTIAKSTETTSTANVNNETESMDVDALSKKIDEKSKQQAEAPIYSTSRYADSDEDSSPYVMMTPLEASSGRKSAPSSTSNHQQKKQKTSTMRSFISFGSRSSAATPSEQQSTSSSTTRKKSSTFSGLRLNRTNSHNSPNETSKRKKNSKSESSHTPPINCSADHAVTTTGTVTTMSALAS